MHEKVYDQNRIIIYFILHLPNESKSMSNEIQNKWKGELANTPPRRSEIGEKNWST